MIFTETRLKGAFLITPERIEDERGFFARSWCQHEFAAMGLTTNLVQASFSYSRRRGTLRGMHYQEAPFAEAKLVRCTRGKIFDAIIDLREDSPTFLRWDAVELSDENFCLVYVPEGCAHGFLTLTDDTEVTYQISQFYAPDAAKGVRFDDPAFGIEWPAPVEVISAKDRNWPDFEPTLLRTGGAR